VTAIPPSDVDLPGRRPLERPARVLTIGAHPDDAEFGCGATLARWASEGTIVTICVVTDGSKGSWDVDEDADRLVARRIAEQERASRTLGVHHQVHLGYVDGELTPTMELRSEIAIQIRTFEPDVVLTHDPWQRYQMHPDHRATGIATVDGVISAREPRALRDSGLAAHRPAALLLWSADRPDHAEPIDDEWFDIKVDALLCHASQVSTTMGDATVGEEQRVTFVGDLRARHVQAGAVLGVGPAETFKRLTP
jgi:LmbE family N-acetylglucosaminyl deacetylase